MQVRPHRATITDHLGNVRATVSDMLLPRTSNTFDADLRTLTDYYPFGMTMPGRSYEAAGIDAHRYGYNGKENDNEVKGEGNQQDYGFRIYDPRVARFLSVDPLAPDYPWYTPYQFAGNTPIQAIDLDGLEPFFVAGTTQTQQDAQDSRIKESVKNVVSTLGLNDLNVTPLNTGFSWSNEDRSGTMKHGGNTLLNGEKARAEAAQLLADYVVSNHVAGQPITLAGYSHGGNVAIQAIPLIRKAVGKDVQINLVTLFTPAFAGRSTENPAKYEADISKHFHFYSWGDAVVPLVDFQHMFSGGAHRDYHGNGKHKNLVQTNVDAYLSNEESKGHGSVYDSKLLKEAASGAKKYDESKKK